MGDKPEPAKLELAPATIVIFGITGDLSTRKLLPSLYELEKNQLLHENTRILGVTRQNVASGELIEKAKTAIATKDGDVDHKALTALSEKIEMYAMNAAKAEDYPELKDYLDKIEDEIGMCTGRIFYLSIPPQISAPVITHLGEQKLNLGCKKHGAKARLLLEKPFGFDVKTAQELIEVTTKYFEESQVFRIDHYLAKETVQNIVTFRFRNPIFEEIWNNSNIQTIEIAANERIDIEGRANFYEQTGALRDLIQSHLLHVMSVVMMDRPADLLSSKDIHASRLALLNSIQPVPADKLSQHALRGQYEGYTKEVDNEVSKMETFATLSLFSNDEKWRDVPIIIKTGKALSAKQTYVTICFKPKSGDYDHTNRLHFNIQPDEGIVIELWVKKPGFKRVMQTAPMGFSYQQAFDEHGHPNAYERVLVDAIVGDSSLFATSDEVMSAWRILQPVLDAWSGNTQDLHLYPKGSDGPDISVLYGIASVVDSTETSSVV